MVKIKKWFIDDINTHLLLSVLILILDLLIMPSLGQFVLQLFGYFVTYLCIKILLDGKKISEIQWQDNIRNFNFGAFNKNSVTVNNNIKSIKEDMRKEFTKRTRVIEKKNRQQETHNKRDHVNLNTSFEHIMEKKGLNTILNRSTINENSVVINGKKYSGSGSISIVNGKVKIGGKNVTDESKCENLIIEVTGDLKNLTIDGDANCIINGNIKGNVSSHNLDCGNVNGNVNAHKVKCGNIGGNVNAHKVTKS